MLPSILSKTVGGEKDDFSDFVSTLVGEQYNVGDDIVVVEVVVVQILVVVVVFECENILHRHSQQHSINRTVKRNYKQTFFFAL